MQGRDARVVARPLAALVAVGERARRGAGARDGPLVFAAKALAGLLAGLLGLVALATLVFVMCIALAD